MALAKYFKRSNKKKDSQMDLMAAPPPVNPFAPPLYEEAVKVVEAHVDRSTKVCAELELRTQTPLKSLREMYEVMVHMLDNYEGTSEGEFLNMALYVALAPRVTYERESVNLHSYTVNYEGGIAYKTSPNVCCPCKDWGVNLAYVTSFRGRPASVTFKVEYSKTRLPGLPLEDIYNSQVEIPDKPGFWQAMQVFKIKVKPDEHGILAFDGTVEREQTQA
ncbi:matrix protein [Scophthalmus maximus rhabdovirus]|uniref:Matrix protein n=1 Tax=Scophthalmus maximus rhabdovirus TaxID=936149 RepID=E7D0U4_9RHAB|nr:matrix protein [Scophthalmus maximus rhabdovirus]ADU05404.1 matrix protein [Scophthalmus maximus rhabdovirus]